MAFGDLALADLIQYAGAGIVLLAFILHQLGRLDRASPRYLIPNAVGAAVIAADALTVPKYGYAILEGAWAAVSAIALITGFRPKPH